MFHSVICPVSSINIDSNVSRMTVFLNVLLLAAYVLTSFPVLILIVAVDYGIRAAWNPQYSLIRWIARQIVAGLGKTGKMINQAPKLFASRIGFMFALTSALLFMIAPVPSLVVAGILMIFAFLDSVFSFCVGCITYTYIVLPFYQYLGIRPRM